MFRVFKCFGCSVKVFRCLGCLGFTLNPFVYGALAEYNLRLSAVAYCNPYHDRVDTRILHDPKTCTLNPKNPA